MSHLFLLGVMARWTYLYIIINIIADVIIAFINVTMYGFNFDWRVGITVWDMLHYTFLPFTSKWMWIFIAGDIIGGAIHSFADYFWAKRSVRYQGNTGIESVDSEPETPVAKVWER